MWVRLLGRAEEETTPCFQEGRPSKGEGERFGRGGKTQIRNKPTRRKKREGMSRAALDNKSG